MKSTQKLSKKSWNITASLAGILLIAYLAFSISANYRSQLDLQQALLQELLQHAEKRATALNYFFSERCNDLRDLSRDRALSVYFENKALGMSMEYGLQASLVGIAEVFDRVLYEKTLGGLPVFTRLTLSNAEGELLVERGEALSNSSAREEGMASSPGGPNPVGVRIGFSTAGPELRVTGPYRFKDKHAGEIQAVISSETVLERLVREGRLSPGRFIYLVAEDGRLLLPADIPPEFPYTVLPGPEQLQPGAISRLPLTLREGGMEEVLVSCFPLSHLPAALVSIVPAAEVYGRISPLQMPVAMALMSLLVLAAMAAAWSFNAWNLTLRINLEQEARNKKDIEEKNRQLIREVAERKRAESALRESEERYRRFFEDDFSGSFITTHDGRILACNPAFAGIFGFSCVDEALRTPVLRLYPDPSKREEFLSMLRRERKLQHHEATYRRMDGQLIHTTENVTGRFDSDGNLLEIQGFVVDQTERRRLEEQLRYSQKMEAIGTLAGGIAHDFNNILTAILGNAEMAMLKLPPEDRSRRNLEEVVKAGNRAKDLVKQILAFSRQTEQERKPLELAPIVKEVLKLLRASLPTTIEIRSDVRSDVGLVLADPIQIHQVLMNLCTNAAHAMSRRGGRLQVGLRRVRVDEDGLLQELAVDGEEFVELTVSDTGCGMERATMERIFDPFFTTKAVGEGTGMGLAVVHGIVEAHGGYVTVESEVGEGSTFRVFLPRIESVFIEHEEARRPPAGIDGRARILLVDDEEVLLDIGKQMLEHLGYQVTESSGSVSALELFRQRPEDFDLVITDLTMPGMTGIELTRRLHDIRPGIPIILCTGYMEMIREDETEELGIKELVTKPFVFSELAEVARRVLAQVRASGSRASSY